MSHRFAESLTGYPTPPLPYRGQSIVSLIPLISHVQNQKQQDGLPFVSYAKISIPFGAGAGKGASQRAQASWSRGAGLWHSVQSSRAGQRRWQR